MPGTLYAFPNSFRANKILIAAQYSGHDVAVDPNFVPGESDKSPEFLRKFPFGKVPAYESGDVRLFQTNGIAHYVGNEQTRGGSNEAEVLQWIGFADNVILPYACTWVYPTQGILQYNKQNTEKAKAELKTALGALNEFLATRTYLVGERISQADISLSCTLSMLYEHVLDPAFRKPFGNVTRWFVTLINQPEFKTVLGEVKLCEEMAQFDAKTYNEIHGKANKKTPQGKKSGGDAKSPKPKKQVPVEDNEPAVKKEKDPWGHLPKTSYDMDAFKRCYSNYSYDASIKYFWDHFDKENYSIWQGTYDFPEDLKGQRSFMVANLIGGMLQRLDKMRKNSFASYCIFKDAGNYEIECIWFWKGHELAFTLSEDWQIDYESYEWKKLDPDCETTKLKVKEFWFQEGHFGGRKFVEGKIYK